jgi:carboxypeptidase Taq
MMDNLSPTYKKLMERTRDMIIFGSAESVIHWDMETMMPPKGIGLRSQQLTLLTHVERRISTNPEIGKLPKKSTAKETSTTPQTCSNESREKN